MMYLLIAVLVYRTSFLNPDAETAANHKPDYWLYLISRAAKRWPREESGAEGVEQQVLISFELLAQNMQYIDR